MATDSKKPYVAPDVTEYGSVESITQQNKIGSGEDEYTELTSLVGSITTV
ncbi:putative RiPP precursor [Natronobiforma cellulositropha]|nr:putative RiPP precursor [Natronobiforma cellulositropha]